MKAFVTAAVLVLCVSSPAFAQHKLAPQTDTCLLTSSDGSFEPSSVTAAKWTTKKYADAQVAKDPEHKKTFDYTAPDEGRATCNEMRPGGALNPAN